MMRCTILKGGSCLSQKKRFIHVIPSSNYSGVSKILAFNQIYDSRDQRWRQKNGN
jgi:hypothetical protein